MGDLLSVGIGGFLGAVLRFGLSGATERWTELTGFPIGTLGANLLGCFAIGLFAAYADQRDLWQSSLRLFVVVGVLAVGIVARRRKWKAADVTSIAVRRRQVRRFIVARMRHPAC